MKFPTSKDGIFPSILQDNFENEPMVKDDPNN